MKLGIMGGTFDPIHWGHVSLAQAALAELGLAKVLLLPDGDPPHKQPQAAKQQRLQMACLAAQQDARLAVSDMELRRPGRTYTVDSLLQLQQEYPGWQLYYIIGSDTLFQFPTWRTADRVAQLCRMVVVLRPGDTAAAVEEKMAEYKATYGLDSVLLHFAGPDISSSRIRQLLAAGQSIDAFTPPAVAEYIRRHELYQHATTMPQQEEKP